jgi:hypothetical protein
MIITTPLSNRNMFAKNIVDPIKLSTCLFQVGMKDSGSKMCKIGRLDGTYVIIRSTLFSKET